MANFVRDNTALPNGKTDLVPLGGGDDPAKNVTAAEWNTVLQASIDLRGWVKTGLVAGTYNIASLTVDADGRITGVVASGGVAAIATSGSASDLVAGTVPAARMPALTGDVTTSAGAVATTIASHVVTYAKQAQAAANTIVGNNTGGTADKTDLTAAQVTAMLNLATSTLQGLAPPSGGGIANFLRADLSWKPAGLLNIQVLTAASGTYTPTTGTTRALALIQAAGGGGGGAGNGAGAAAGGGGASGALLLVFAGSATAALTGGAFTNSTTGGTAGANTGGNGGTGGDASIGLAGVTYTAKGGNGGGGMAATTGGSANGGTPQAGSTSTGAVLFEGSQPGVGGIVIGSAPDPGNGGSSWFGTGGRATLTSAADGTNASGFGAGGGGGTAINTGGHIGGTGSPSKIVVIEFA